MEIKIVWKNKLRNTGAAKVWTSNAIIKMDATDPYELRQGDLQNILLCGKKLRKHSKYNPNFLKSLSLIKLLHVTNLKAKQY